MKKFIDILHQLNEKKIKVTPEMEEMYAIIEKRFKEKDEFEVKRWGKHIHFLNIDEFIDYSHGKVKENQSRKLIFNLIDIDKIEIVSRSEHSFTYTKKYNYGQSRVSHTGISGSMMIIPSNWPFKEE